MKKKVLLISLALALVATTLIPATAFAAGWAPSKKPIVKNFTSVMTITAIDSPVVSGVGVSWPEANPAGTNSWPIKDLVEGKPTTVGWIVTKRSAYADISGNLMGTGIFTYGGILDLLQSGSMDGILVVNTGGLDSLYLSADGKLAATATEYYDFQGVAAWCQGAGLPVGMFFAQIYDAPVLALLPDGNMSFGQLQTWCAAIGVPIVQFFYGVYGDVPPPGPDNPDEATLKAMYESGLLPPISGLGILGSMYGTALPPLPKTMNANFSGTLRIETGTGVYSGANGQGQFGPYKKEPLTLHVSPAQHVDSVEGKVQIAGTYTNRTFEPRKIDLDRLRDSMKNWKDRFPFPGRDNDRKGD